MKYHLLWGDYDGERQEEFDSADAVADRLGQLEAQHPPHSRNGYSTPTVIRGEKLKIVPVETATKFIVQ